MTRFYRLKAGALSVLLTLAAVSLVLDTVDTWTHHVALLPGARSILVDGALGTIMHTALLNLYDRRQEQRRHERTQDHQ